MGREVVTDDQDFPVVRVEAVIVENCHHSFVFDPETLEIICERGCGWAVGVYDRKELVHAPDGRKLSSPSVRDNNLGSDQNVVIRDLRKGVVDPVAGKRKHLLSGALRFFPNDSTNRNENLIEELTDRLHGRVSDSDLAAIAEIYRRVLRRLEREKREKALRVLDQITGGATSA